MAKYKGREIARAYELKKQPQWGLWLFWGIVAIVILSALSN